MSWKSRPIFISSTFLDMQAERDFLRNFVFLELEEWLRARRHHLEWIDLRLVATASSPSEEARELAVLKVCLAEVKRSRPFLIALIGDRYGWVPPEDRIRAAAAEEGFSVDLTGRSVTELEIDFGVLSDPEQRKRSFFYFREPLPYAEMGEAAKSYSEEFDTNPEAARRAAKLRALKERISKHSRNHVRSYSARWDGRRVIGFEKELRRKVLEDIKAELAAETGEALSAGEVSWQQAERDAMADFAEDRQRDFKGRDKLLHRIKEFVTSGQGKGSHGLCITGVAGAGKSAVWGKLHAWFAQAQIPVLSHAAGASPRASSIDAMLRRWIEELASDLSVPSGLAEAARDEDVEATFASLLGRVAQKRRVVVLIDALDQFEQTTRAIHMTWLPKQWPENARLIATAIPGEASRTLLQRAWAEEIPLEPLHASEVCDIIAAVCGRYGRSFEPQVIDALLLKPGEAGPACGNPLWLAMAVEELNLLDADDFARARRDYRGMPPAVALRAMMCEMLTDEMPADIPGLYAWSFDRATALFGAPLTEAFLGAISVSRGGWREADFRKLLPKLSAEPWDELRFAQLRRTFRGQMRRRGALGQWDFAHGLMRSAVRAWLKDQSARPDEEVQAVIADHLLALPADDPLHVSETLLHLMVERDAPARAREYYGKETLTDAEAHGASRALADLLLMVPAVAREGMLSQILRLLDSGADPRSSRLVATAAQRLLFDFAQLIEQRVETKVQGILFDRVRAAYEHGVDTDPGNSTWQHDLGASQIRAGNVSMKRGDLAGALKSYRDSLAVFSDLLKARPTSAGRQRDLSVCHYQIGEVLALQGEFAGALQSHRVALAIRENIVRADPENAKWQPDLLGSYERVGNVLKAQGDLAGAEESYRESLNIAERLVKLDPNNADWQRDAAVSYINVGELQATRGDLASALKLYLDSLVIRESLANSDPGNSGRQRDLWLGYHMLGMLLDGQHNRTTALEYYCKSLGVIEHLATADPENAEWQRDLAETHIRIFSILEAGDDRRQALEAGKGALRILDRLAHRGIRLSPDLSKAKELIRQRISAFELHMGNRQTASPTRSVANPDASAPAAGPGTAAIATSRMAAPGVSFAAVHLIPETGGPMQLSISCDLKVDNKSRNTVTFNVVKCEFLIGDDGVYSSAESEYPKSVSLLGGQSLVVNIKSGSGYGNFIGEETKLRVRVMLLNDNAIVLDSTELLLPTSIGAYGFR